MRIWTEFAQEQRKMQANQNWGIFEKPTALRTSQNLKVQGNALKSLRKG